MAVPSDPLFGEHVRLRPHATTPNALANHYRSRDGRWFIMARQ